jgi:hypothetical protein
VHRGRVGEGRVGECSAGSEAVAAGGVPRGRPGRTVARRFLVPLLGASAASVLLAACGGSSGRVSASPTTTAAAPTGSSGAPPVPRVSGTVAQVSGTTLEVQNPTTGQTTVQLTPATRVTDEVVASAGALRAGLCATAFGRSGADGELVATAVVLRQPPSAGSCITRPPGASVRRFAGRGRPAGLRRRFARAGVSTASGTIGTVGSGTFTLVTPKATRTVAYTASTSFVEAEVASASAVAVGDCVTAVGPANSIGTITARSLVLSSPGPHGCTAPPFGRGAGASGAGSGGAAGA